MVGQISKRLKKSEVQKHWKMWTFSILTKTKKIEILLLNVYLFDDFPGNTIP